MKTIAIIVTVLLSACVTEDEAPIDNGVSYAYCGLHLSEPVPYGGDIIGGPCQLSLTVDMFCPAGDDPAFNRLVVAWYTAEANQILETTYQCNTTTTLKFGNTVCKGQPITAVAGFQDPMTGEFDGTEGERICADKVVSL